MFNEIDAAAIVKLRGSEIKMRSGIQETNLEDKNRCLRRSEINRKYYRILHQKLYIFIFFFSGLTRTKRQPYLLHAFFSAEHIPVFKSSTNSKSH